MLRHEVLSLRLPLRTVNIADYARAAADLAALVAREPADDTSPESAYARFVARTQEREKLPVPGPYDDKNDDFVLMRNLEAVVQRFRLQQRDPIFPAEVHVLRIGDLALSTSPFELYLDYGLRIRARCPAALTLHVQLCLRRGRLPADRAGRGRGRVRGARRERHGGTRGRPAPRREHPGGAAAPVRGLSGGVRER